MSNRAIGCRCGSGGHPRRCEVHPFAFDAHVADINFTDWLDSDMDEGETHDTFIAELRRRYDVKEKSELENLRHRCQEEDRMAERIRFLERENNRLYVDIEMRNADNAALRAQAERDHREANMMIEGLFNASVREESLKAQLASLRKAGSEAWAAYYTACDARLENTGIKPAEELLSKNMRALSAAVRAVDASAKNETI